MLSDTSYKTRSFLKKPTPFMGGSISRVIVNGFLVYKVVKKT